MALYLIGDIQGCNDALGRLLDTVAFSPSRDTVVLLGDLVNRGPDNVGVVRRLMALGGSAHSLLGNHDLHLLAIAQGIRIPHRGDTVQDVLNAPDREGLLNWLRHQHLALLRPIDGQDLLMVHAGVLPQWTAQQTLALASEVQTVLRGPDYALFLSAMYGNTPDQWNDHLQGYARLRIIVNALTRLRFCSADGTMEFTAKEGADESPPGYMPWFEVPQRRSANTPIAFGHWSSLGFMDQHHVVCLDTGCVWGGCLSALEIQGAKAGGGFNHRLIQVPCAP